MVSLKPPSPASQWNTFSRLYACSGSFFFLILQPPNLILSAGRLLTRKTRPVTAVECDANTQTYLRSRYHKCRWSITVRYWSQCRTTGCSYQGDWTDGKSISWAGLDHSEETRSGLVWSVSPDDRTTDVSYLEKRVLNSLSVLSKAAKIKK